MNIGGISSPVAASGAQKFSLIVKGDAPPPPTHTRAQG